MKIVIFLMLVSIYAYSTGFLVPKEKNLEPFFIKSQRVEAIIKNGAAQTTIKEVFINPYSRDLEGIFVFPLPKGAGVTDFEMKINGKWVKGKVLEKNKARNIYQRIVRQMKDPGLIEYMGNDMFKASVYPIPANGETEIKITYVQTIKLTKNIYSYIYPLKGFKKSTNRVIYTCSGRYYTVNNFIRRKIRCNTSKNTLSTVSTKEDFTFSAKIESDIPITSVYSPTHKISVLKKLNTAFLGFEKNNFRLNKDIKIYYSVNNEKIGANLLAYDPENGKNGYFMLMISPQNEISQKEIENKNLILTVDTSGSMAGEKMKYAKKALKYIIKKLNDNDTFNIIGFSSGIYYFKESPVKANTNNKKEALKYIDEMDSGGGTAIDEAIKSSLKQAKQEKPNMMIFITDGRPTVGENDINEIVKNSVKNNKNNIKIFSFGIGDDLNAVLLDKLSDKNNGSSDFIKPGAEIEAIISSFYDKVAFPVLSNVTIKIEGIKVYDLYPYKINDLFKGEEVRIFGRYKNKEKNKILSRFFTIKNKAILTLKGRNKNGEKIYKYTLNFKSYKTNDFIPSIWANKKVGFLLEEIRLNGEKKELVDEVKKLALKYGIVTPYTSYLVTEKEEATDDAQTGNIIRTPKGGVFGRIGRRRVYKAKSLTATPPALDSFKTASGKRGVRVSKKLKEMKKSDIVANQPTIKTIGDKTFVLKGKFWIDNSENKSFKEVRIKYLSKTYIKLITKSKKLKKYLSIAKNIIIYFKGYKIIIDEDYNGKEKLPNFTE